MARPQHKLTSAELKAKSPGKYSDGGGLWFHKRADGLCCINRFRDSLCESSVVAGCDEQLDTEDVQDPELGRV